MNHDPADGEGQLYTLGLLEQLRAECSELWGESSNLYHRVDGLLRELANPNLHDIPTRLPFRVELWDRNDQHIRWVIAASSSVAIGHAALNAAIANYPDQRFTLRNGILVIREYAPELGKQR
ncbi:MAG: hypothetical protein ABR881_32460 [Candidatus Sulfotelmatobacter sp.]|jgi:hypothetical protein